MTEQMSSPPLKPLFSNKMGIKWKKYFLPTVLFAFISGGNISAQTFTVSGFIYDSVSSEPLIAASVSGGAKGCVTNNYGFYSISLPQGATVLEYGHVGYASEKVEIRIRRDTTVTIYLKPGEELTAATVVARSKTGIRSTYMGAIDVPVAQIKVTPSVLGEADILKTLQLLPGVQSGINGFTGLYVRGGGPDENLLMLDGISLYNVDHLFGLFSVFMPESVKKVTLYKGSFPARFGGRVSSVVDVRTNDGNTEATHGSAGISLLSSKLHVEGPIRSGKTTFSASARVMNTILLQPLIARMNINDRYNYWFYDLNGKVTHRIGERDRLYFNVYNGRDLLFYAGTSVEETKTTIQWGNTLASARWNHVWSNKVFSNMTLAYNRYGMETLAISDYKDIVMTEPAPGSDINMEDLTPNPEYKVIKEHSEVNYLSGINDINLMADFEFTPSSRHSIRYGTGFIYHVFNPETLGASTKIDENGLTIQDTTFTQGGGPLKGLEWSAYLEDDITFGNHLSINPGVHFNMFKSQERTHYSLQPRFSIRYGFENGLSFKAAYSRMAQNIHLLSSTQITLPMDLWVPVTDNIKPVVSDQFSVGAYFDGMTGWDFSVEGYYKSMDNVLAYRDGVVILGNSTDWQDKVIMGEGRAYGAEFFIQKTTGKTTGWLAYTLAKSERRFGDGATGGSGKWFPYKYDRRHQLHLVVNHSFSPRIDLNGTWSFSTGGVITLPERETVVLSPDGKQTYQTALLSTRGNYRLPASHRLNIGVNFRKKKKKGERVWTLSAYNLYNYPSADLVIVSSNKRVWNSTYNHNITLKMVTILPILPSVGYTYNF